jgi:hypothetical protein
MIEEQEEEWENFVCFQIERTSMNGNIVGNKVCSSISNNKKSIIVFFVVVVV